MTFREPKSPAAGNWKKLVTPRQYQYRPGVVAHWYNRELGASVISTVENGLVYQLKILAARKDGGNFYYTAPGDALCQQVLEDFGFANYVEAEQSRVYTHRVFQMGVG